MTNDLDDKILEEARDVRTSDELLLGIVHLGTWEGRSDVEADFWKSSRNYQFYAGIAAYLKPRTVLEIGVRLGYSLISMFRGFMAIESMMGLDTEMALRGSQTYSLVNLRSVGYTAALELPIADRKWLAGLPTGCSFDLVHIDGQHSAEDVEADILSSWPHLSPGGILIADDTDYAPRIRSGIESARSTLSDVRTAFYFSTLRGWWVARKK